MKHLKEGLIKQRGVSGNGSSLTLINPYYINDADTVEFKLDLKPIKPNTGLNIRWFIFNGTPKEFESLAKQYGIYGWCWVVYSMNIKELENFVKTNILNNINKYVDDHGGWIEFNKFI